MRRVGAGWLHPLVGVMGGKPFIIKKRGQINKKNEGQGEMGKAFRTKVQNKYCKIGFLV
jgi:hypothetical protein